MRFTLTALLCVLMFVIATATTAGRAHTRFESIFTKKAVADAVQLPGDDVANQETKNSGVSQPLSETQRESLKVIMAGAKKLVGPVVLELGQSVRKIHVNMLADRPDAIAFRRLDRKIARLTGELVSIRTEANQRMVRVLTPAQKQLIRAELAKHELSDISEALKRVFGLPEE